MQHFRIMLRANGLTEQQWRVLRALTPDREIGISDLAEATFLLAASLSRILPDLAERELVVIRNDTLDQRKKLVRITPLGIGLIDTIAPLSEEIYSEIEARFGKKRLHDLQTLLLELEAGLQDMGGVDAP